MLTKALAHLRNGAMQPIEVEDGELNGVPVFFLPKLGASTAIELIREVATVSETRCNLYFNDELECCNTRSNFKVGENQSKANPQEFYELVMACIDWFVKPNRTLAIFLSSAKEVHGGAEMAQGGAEMAQGGAKEVQGGTEMAQGGAVEAFEAVTHPMPKWKAVVFPPGFFNPEELNE
jgi:hypothetical protein